jgi:MoaA/NifB/PqqE/SkfB family radical SAM enzyme
MTPSPLVVVWRVTEACDLGCVFCAYSRELRRPRTRTSADDVLAFGALLAEHGRAAGRPVMMSWLGGEPTLWPPLMDVGRRLRDLGLLLGITTNGAHLAPELSAHLAQHYAQVTFSLDGLPDWHDHVRGRAGLSNHVEAAIRDLLSRRAGRAPLVRVNVVIMRSNLFDFGRLCEQLAGWGVDEVTFNALGGRDRGGGFFDAERLSPEHVAWLRGALPGIRARVGPRGLSVRGSRRYLGRLENGARGRPVPVLDCAPGHAFLFVDAHGRVSPCSYTTDDLGVSMADFRAAADLERLPEMFSAHRDARRPTACDDCASTQVFGKFDP